MKTFPMFKITSIIMYTFHPGVFAVCFMVNCPGRGVNPSSMSPPKGGGVSLYWAGDFSRCRLTGGDMYLAREDKRHILDN